MFLFGSSAPEADTESNKCARSVNAAFLLRNSSPARISKQGMGNLPTRQSSAIGSPREPPTTTQTSTEAGGQSPLVTPRGLPSSSRSSWRPGLGLDPQCDSRLGFAHAKADPSRWHPAHSYADPADKQFHSSTRTGMHDARQGENVWRAYSGEMPAGAGHAKQGGAPKYSGCGGVAGVSSPTAGVSSASRYGGMNGMSSACGHMKAAGMQDYFPHEGRYANMAGVSSAPAIPISTGPLASMGHASSRQPGWNLAQDSVPARPELQGPGARAAALHSRGQVPPPLTPRSSAPAAPRRPPTAESYGAERAPVASGAAERAWAACLPWSQGELSGLHLPAGPQSNPQAGCPSPLGATAGFGQPPSIPLTPRGSCSTPSHLAQLFGSRSPVGEQRWPGAPTAPSRATLPTRMPNLWARSPEAQHRFPAVGMSSPQMLVQPPTGVGMTSPQSPVPTTTGVGTTSPQMPVPTPTGGRVSPKLPERFPGRTPSCPMRLHSEPAPSQLPLPGSQPSLSHRSSQPSLLGQPPPAGVWPAAPAALQGQPILAPGLEKEVRLLQELERRPDEEKSGILLFAEGLLEQRVSRERDRRLGSSMSGGLAAAALQPQQPPPQASTPAAQMRRLVCP